MLLSRSDSRTKLNALDSAHALIEFDLEGTVVSANRNFLALLGYGLDEIRGEHHSLFVDPAERESPTYKEFWAALRRGEHQVAECKRIGKGGREVWIQGSYSPLIGRNGKPYGVFKCATDVTAQTLRNADFEGKLDALNRRRALSNSTSTGRSSPPTPTSSGWSATGSTR